MDGNLCRMRIVRHFVQPVFKHRERQIQTAAVRLITADFEAVGHSSPRSPNSSRGNVSAEVLSAFDSGTIVSVLHGECVTRDVIGKRYKSPCTLTVLSYEKATFTR